MARILVLEDDPILAKSLCFNIERHGNEAVWSASVLDCSERLVSNNFDLILLDIQLPDGSGLELCKKLRHSRFSGPIFMITANSAEDSAVEGLMTGANDYIKKPFSMRELMARIHVHLKNSDKLPCAKSVQFQDLKVEYEQRRAVYKGRELPLKPTKIDILYFMLINHDRVISRDSLLQFLQKENEVFDRTIDAHISQLRRILKAENIEFIRITSIYGIGYKLDSEKALPTSN